MRNPCQLCERALLDKSECSLNCERRHEYCRFLGISVTGGGYLPGASPVEKKINYLPKPPNLPKAPKVPKAPKPPFDWHAPRGMRSKSGRLEKATVLMKEGKTNQEVCRQTGMSKSTAAKLRGVLEEKNGGPFLCACGKPATHQGWCSYRIAKSPGRQKFLASFGEDTPSTPIP